jgi:hypothetical protein
MPASYTARQILDALDYAPSKPGARPRFPQFDEAYIYPVDARLTAYRDDHDWAIVIERLGFNPRGVGHGGIRVDLYWYGTGATGDHDRYGFRQESINVTSDGPDGPTFENLQDVRADVRSIRIRGVVVPVDTRPEFYAPRGVDLEVMSESHAADLLRSYDRRQRAFEKHPSPRPRRPDARERYAEELRRQVENYRGQTHFEGHHLLRGLLPEHRQALLATDAERRARLREGLPQFLQLDQWYHPDIFSHEFPSETETFVQLADALATGDAARYHPTVPPNTHWRNWPDGGNL